MTACPVDKLDFALDAIYCICNLAVAVSVVDVCAMTPTPACKAYITVHRQYIARDRHMSTNILPRDGSLGHAVLRVSIESVKYVRIISKSPAISKPPSQILRFSCSHEFFRLHLDSNNAARKACETQIKKKIADIAFTCSAHNRGCQTRGAELALADKRAGVTSTRKGP